MSFYLQSFEPYIKSEPNRGYEDETPIKTPTPKRKRKIPETQLKVQPPKQIRNDEPLQQPPKKTYNTDDSFETFGRFVASELRSIPNSVVAHKIQRKLQRLLIDSMDELDGIVMPTSVSKPQAGTSVQKADNSGKVTFFVEPFQDNLEIYFFFSCK